MSSCKMTLVGLLNWDPNLFEYLELPDSLDKATLISNIIARGGEFEVLYADAEFVKQRIGYFSNKWARTFERWAEALKIEYNPLENYDRIEEWTENGDGDTIAKGLDKISAYNSDTMRDNTSSNTDSNYRSNLKHTGRLHGNIGVTTSQQMLESELQIAEWNLYDHITDLFLSEFVLPVY